MTVKEVWKKMEQIGHTVRELVERLERTAKARNEAPGRLKGRDELERDGCPVNRAVDTQPSLNAGESIETKDRAIAPRVSGMLCRQQRGSTGYGPSCRSIPVRPAAANCNRPHVRSFCFGEGAR